MGKKSSKSTTTSKPWAPAQPYLLGAANTIQNTVAQQQPMLNSLSQQVQSYLPGLAQKAFGADAGLDAAKKYNIDVLGGKYLGQGNPYLAGMIAQTGDNVMNRVNSLFGTAGRSLSGQHEGVVSRELANAENSLRYQDYGNERNAMAQAASAMPGITGAEVARVAPYLAATETAAQVPFAGIQNLGQIGSLFSGYGTQTSKQPGGWGTQLLGAAASALPFITGGI